MGRERTPLHAVIATLCAALAVVFAGASAASVLDRVQHEAQLRHEHGLHLSFGGDEGRHDHTAQGRGGDHEDDVSGNVGDHQPGLGHHHHTDAPSGALSGVLGAPPMRLVADAGLRASVAASTEGVRPGGLERPPRTTDRPD